MTEAATNHEVIRASFSLSEDDFVDGMLGLKSAQAIIEKSPAIFVPVSFVLIVASIILAFSTEMTVFVWAAVVTGLLVATGALFFGSWQRAVATKVIIRHLRRQYRDQPCHISNLTVDASGLSTQCHVANTNTTGFRRRNGMRQSGQLLLDSKINTC